MTASVSNGFRNVKGTVYQLHTLCETSIILYLCFSPIPVFGKLIIGRRCNTAVYSIPIFGPFISTKLQRFAPVYLIIIIMTVIAADVTKYLDVGRALSTGDSVKHRA